MFFPGGGLQVCCVVLIYNSKMVEPNSNVVDSGKCVYTF